MKKINGKLLELERETPAPMHAETGLCSLSAEISQACDLFWERRGRNRFGGVGEAKHAFQRRLKFGKGAT